MRHILRVLFLVVMVAGCVGCSTNDLHYPPAISDLGLFVREGLSPENQLRVDSEVDRRMQDKQKSLVKSSDLLEWIKKLSLRKEDWNGWSPATKVGFLAKEFRDQRLPLPAEIDEKVVNDIIWQFNNPSGTLNEQLYHKEECVRALCYIGSKTAVPTVLKALEGKPGHSVWQGLSYLPDERYIPLIEKNLDFNCYQDTYPVIKYLGKIGLKAIPTLNRFILDRDSGNRSRALEALAEIGDPKCLPILESALPEKDYHLAAKIKEGIGRIRCRKVDRICSPPKLELGESDRVYHLVDYLLEAKPFTKTVSRRHRSIATKNSKLSKVGVYLVWNLRLQLKSYAHADCINGPPIYFVAEEAGDELVGVGEPAIPYLIDALCDEHSHSREIAARALQKVTGISLGPKYELWRDWYVKKSRKSPVQGYSNPFREERKNVEIEQDGRPSGLP